MPSTPLRPPGAEPVGRFLSLCTHCGQCAEACPFSSIVLEAGLNPLESGTPKVIPKRMPCWLCMRCGLACPTGALAPVEKTKAGMGTAVIDRKRCFTYIGSIICRTCFEKCPLKARAITLELALYPVITKECVGCGVCENVCPAQCIDTLPPGSAITPEEPVDPSQLDKKAAWGPEFAPAKVALAESAAKSRPERHGILGTIGKVFFG